MTCAVPVILQYCSTVLKLLKHGERCKQRDAEREIDRERERERERLREREIKREREGWRRLYC